MHNCILSHTQTFDVLCYLTKNRHSQNSSKLSQTQQQTNFSTAQNEQILIVDVEEIGFVSLGLTWTLSSLTVLSCFSPLDQHKSEAWQHLSH